MNYQVIIAAAITSNQSIIIKILSRTLGINPKINIEKLVKEGGIVAQNLTEKEAKGLANQIQKLGAKVRIEEMTSPEPQDPKDSEDQEDFVVSGRVFNSKGIKMPFSPIVLVDKNVGKDIPLEKGKTEKDGSYEIHYKPKTATDHLDIQVQVMADEKDKKQMLAKSSVRYNAKPVEEHLDIVVSVEKLPKTDAEYIRLLSKLKDQLVVKTEAQLTKTLAALKEDDEQQDITYLANKTGWDARLIAMMALSHEKSITTDLPAALYYALYRSAIPTDGTALFNTNVHTVNSIWKKAIEQNIIDPSWEDELDKSLDLFKKNSAKIRLNDEALGGVSTMDHMLSLTLKNDKQKQEFANRYFNQNPKDENFWEGIEKQFGKDLKNRLQLDGKLGVLTLNNAPLIKILRDQKSINEDPIELVRNGFYKISAWEKLIKEYKIPLPADLPGEKDTDKYKIYAASMTQQLKASYPTAVLAAQVKGQELSLNDTGSQTQVVDFLNTYQESFIIGQQPIIQFIKEKELVVETPVINELKRLERLYQMSPSDEAMKVLSDNGINSAHAVVQLGEEVVVNKLVSAGLDSVQAHLVYEKSLQVQNTILNLATAGITNKNTPPISVLNPLGKQENEANNPGIIAYPTLEGLFGEMDFCDCNHCRSVLSPAAYLVDLLQFINKSPADFDGRTGQNPLDALLDRRPDIAHIQLTCENTNTVLPYIDLVNEILEHYSVNKSLADFRGYNNTGDRSTEELLANPQFVEEEAYKILKKQVYPLELPFNQPLIALRRLFDHLEIPLYQAMQSLRADDKRGTWQNITMEYLGISPDEYAIFTQNEKTIAEYYGEEANSDLNALFIQNNTFAKDFSRKLGVSYKEVTRLVKTQFINPVSRLIPKLENLQISIHNIVKFVDGSLSNEQLEALLPHEFTETLFDGNVKAWLKEHADAIKNLIFFVDPKKTGDDCNFVQLELRRANDKPLTELDYFKFMRFIRFWKKLGWTIEQTDKTITALWSNVQDANTVELLNDGFATLINRTAHLKRVMALLNSNPKQDLSKVLGLFGLIDTQAPESFYKELFLNSTITAHDTVFWANSSVDYLTDDVKILEHEPAILAAFNLNSENLRLILERLKTTQDLSDIQKVSLNMINVTTIHRYAYLSRQLKLSLKEMFILQDLTQINPFETLEEFNPSLIKFIELAQRLNQSSLTIPQITYYLRHEDLSGESSPSDDDLLAMAYQLKEALQHVENEHQAMGDTTGEIVRAKMILVYPLETVDQFFSIIKNDLNFTTTYAHHKPVLESEFQDVRDKLSYNDFQKTLVFKGVMSDKELHKIKTAANAISKADHNQADFLMAIQTLFDEGQGVLENLFSNYPELKAPYHNFTTNRNFEKLLSKILDDFKERLKKLTVIQTLADALGTEHDIVATLLEDKNVLLSSMDTELADPKYEPAIEDYLALESNGVSVVYIFENRSEKKQTIKNINISPKDLEVFDTPPLKEVQFSFYVKITETAFYNFSLKTNDGANISFSVNKNEIEGGLTDGIWKNTESVELAAHGYILIEIQITNLTDIAILEWATENKATYRLLPNNKLYPKEPIEIFKQSYLRFLKASALLASFEMSQEEIRYFSNTFKIKGSGFLNAIPIHFDPSKTDIIQNLWKVILGFWDYQELKTDFDVKEEDLVNLLDNPKATYLDSQNEKKSLLLKTTDWSKNNLNELLEEFSLELSDLKNINNFHRIWEAYQLVTTSGLPAKTLLGSTTNNPDPDSDQVKTMKQALRVKYNTNAWLQVIQPINDILRNEQRDALVAYVLQLMQKTDNTKTINTAEKLFEYFLIDVKMDACMKTSRIKQAISSVQLFVQRALLNLEQQKGDDFGVDPASINSKQWEWMKRYRVWEANRKVFISPENWLEPELRDNKSPFFKELESELLQSDITEDQARNVMLNYLEKLDGVAKLDVAGMCLQENQEKKDGVYYDADDVLHVFGKTQGTTTKYYYRRYEGGYFTPWEKVDLDIEGTPLLPVIWNDRLFLFWLNVIQKGVKNNDSPLKNGTSSSTSDTEGKREDDGEYRTVTHVLTQPSQSNKLMDATFDSSALQGKSKINVEISLSWSEYFNGKWQPRRMSDVEEDSVFLQNLEADQFKRSNIKLFSNPGLSKPENLVIQVRYEGSYLRYRDFVLSNIRIAKPWVKNFNFLNGAPISTNNLSPEKIKSLEQYYVSQGIEKVENKYRSRHYRRLFKSSGIYVSFYSKRVSDELSFTHKILKDNSLFTKEPKHFYSSPYHTPFFLQNEDHVFFVQLKEEWIPIQKNNDYGVLIAAPDLISNIELTPVFEKPDTRVLPDPKLGFDPGYVDPFQLEHNFGNETIKYGLPNETKFVFKGRVMGASNSRSQVDINTNQLFNQ